VNKSTLAILACIGGGIALAGAGIVKASSQALSVADITRYASNAGFADDDLITAVAIALAESGGNPNAHGDLSLPGSGSYGLWQIYAHAHPEFGPDFTQLYDPQTNANAAYSVYVAAGYDFRQWSTFKGGQYKAFISTVSDSINA
jgi:Lysozyme like domain